LEEKKIGEDMGMNSTIKLPTLNPDGTSVKGCVYIYAPRGQAGEYAPLATNPYRAVVRLWLAVKGRNCCGELNMRHFANIEPKIVGMIDVRNS
jgi:hypothetical protein